MQRSARCSTLRCRGRAAARRCSSTRTTTRIGRKCSIFSRVASTQRCTRPRSRRPPLRGAVGPVRWELTGIQGRLTRRIEGERTVNNRLRMGACCTAALAVAASVRVAAADETFEQAVRDSKFIIDTRLRYEGVEQTGFSKDAEALTARLRAGLQTAPWYKTSFLAEGVWVGDPVDDYNSTTNGQTQYPVVADPANFTAVNRFEVINQSLEHTTLTAGRQRIVLDDQRFVGNVGWRQNEQTFDGLRAQLAGPNI